MTPETPRPSAARIINASFDTVINIAGNFGHPKDRAHLTCRAVTAYRALQHARQARNTITDRGGRYPTKRDRAAHIVHLIQSEAREIIHEANQESA